MTETVGTPHEPEQQASPMLGFNYEKLPLQGEWIEHVIVPVIRTPEKTTYLVPIAGQDDGRWQERVRALKANDIPCHLLPSAADHYSEQESQFARETLQQPATETRTPYTPRLRGEEALVFDPKSVKSVLDVMIAAGQDTPDIRRARLAALRGETNDIADTLGKLLELGTLYDANDAQAAALRTAFGLHDARVYAMDIIEQLTESGLDMFPYRRIRQRLEEGIDPELVKATVTNPEKLQQATADGWKQMITFAREHNKDIYNSGIYTELHRMGGVVIALPALASTAWEKKYPEMLRHVDVRGLAHTLAEIYESMSLDPKGESPNLIHAIHNFPLIQLSRKLGVLASGPSTLQRRCLTTFDADGQPIIHLREADPYNGRPDKMSDERIEQALARQGIHSDVVAAQKIQPAGITPETAQNEVIVHIEESEMYSKERLANRDDALQIPLACITELVQDGDMTDITWRTGYTGWHDALIEEGNTGEPIDYFNLELALGDETVRMRANYIGEALKTGKKQAILWHFSGDSPEPLLRYADTVKHMIGTANRSIAAYMQATWGVAPESLETKAIFQDSATEADTDLGWDDLQQRTIAG